MRPLAAALAALMLAAPAAAETIKIGVVTTLSGPDSTPGNQVENGLRLYLKEHGGELPPGVTIELIVRDDTGPNAEVAKRLAQELITRDHVQMITGVLFSPNALAIAPLVTEAKIPFIDTNAAFVALTRKSPYIVRVSFTLWQTAYPLGQWTAQQGAKLAYTAVSDYAPGYDAEAGFSAGFTEAGGKMAGAVRFPLANHNYVPYLQRMIDAHPQIAYIFTPVGEAVGMMRAVDSLNFKGAGITMVSTMDLVPDDQLPDMGDVALGLITSGTYSAMATRPQNLKFVAAWQRAYGKDQLPDFAGEQGWDSMAAIVAVVKATGGKFDGDQAMAILKHWKNPDSPRGPIAIDPETRDIVENIYIRKVEKVNGRLGNVEFATVPQIKDPWKERNPEK